MLDDIPELSDDDLARLTPEERKEFAERLEAAHWARAKTSFRHYCTLMEVPGAPITIEEEGKYYTEKVSPAPHHDLIIDAIQDFAESKHPELDGMMVFMPPGSAKSTYLTVLGASWLMGYKPGTNLISTSYGNDLATRFGRRTRTVVGSKEFGRVFGANLVADNRAVLEWACSNGSDYRGASVMAGVTGFRADYLLIDDPIKGREEAESPIIRQKVWDSYLDDLDSRLKPGGKTLIAMTRWHEDDPAGRILGEEWKGQSGLWRGTDGKMWLIINLPLLAEKEDDPLGRALWKIDEATGNRVPIHKVGDYAYGELLWPTWFKLTDALRRAKNALKGGTFARSFSSLYQQRPSPHEGSILQKKYWQEWKKTELPECEKIFLCYDTAIEEEEANDYSAMTAWGVFKWISKKTTGEEYNHRHVILLGAWEERVSAVDLITHVLDHNKMFQPDRIMVEKRASGHQLIQELRRRRLPVYAWLPKGKPGTKGKTPRAHGVAAVLEQGSVWYVPGIKTQRVIDNCAAVPFGVHDDLADTVTMMLSYFRDKWIFQTADDELSEEELKDVLIERAETRKKPRKLYGQNERRAIGKHDLDIEDIKRMTPESQRRLYGGKW